MVKVKKALTFLAIVSLCIVNVKGENGLEFFIRENLPDAEYYRYQCLYYPLEEVTAKRNPQRLLFVTTQNDPRRAWVMVNKKIVELNQVNESTQIRKDGTYLIENYAGGGFEIEADSRDNGFAIEFPAILSASSTQWNKKYELRGRCETYEVDGELE